MSDETETVQVVHIVPPGRSLRARLLPQDGSRGQRVHLLAKTIIKPGRYVGIDKAEMDAMVKRGELQKVPITTVGALPDNYDPGRKGTTLQTGTKDKPLDADAPTGGANVPRRNLNPIVLRQQVADGAVSLDQLNTMVRERDQSMPPFNEADPAINWLSVEHDSRPPAPPPAAPGAPVPPAPQG